MSFLPLRDLEYLESHGYAYDQKESGGQKGIVLKGIPLPEAKYNANGANVDSVNVLVILPNGYPDAQPDMFHTDPWIRLRASGSYPRAADQPVSFADINWQRWSRHSDQWRPGRDGIWTMIKRLEHAIEIAE